MASSILVEVVNDVLVSAHSVDSFTHQEWTEYVQRLKECQRQHGRARELVLNISKGGPNAAQRKYLSDQLDVRAIDTAVMTSNVVVRGMVTALAWLRVSAIRAFADSDFDGAANHLRLQGASREAVRRKLEEFRTVLIERRKAAS